MQFVIFYIHHISLETYNSYKLKNFRYYCNQLKETIDYDKEGTNTLGYFGHAMH